MAQLKASAVLVTRGDVDMTPVLASLEPVFDDIVVWNNAERDDLKVYGHFAAIPEAKHDWIYMQDDDAICPAQAILDAWKPEYADKILLNVPDGETPWISWGSLFHRDLPTPAFAKYLLEHPGDDDFLLWPDVIFTTLTPWINIDLPVQHLPWAHADNRMWKQPGHYGAQARVKARCEALK